MIVLSTGDQPTTTMSCNNELIERDKTEFYMCRLCLGERFNSKNCYSKKLNFLAKKYLGISLDQQDFDLPLGVCSGCQTILEQFHKFALDCIVSENVLKYNVYIKRKTIQSSNIEEFIGFDDKNDNDVLIKLQLIVKKLQSELDQCYITISDEEGSDFETLSAPSHQSIETSEDDYASSRSDSDDEYERCDTPDSFIDLFLDKPFHQRRYSQENFEFDAPENLARAMLEIHKSASSTNKQKRLNLNGTMKHCVRGCLCSSNCTIALIEMTIKNEETNRCNCYVLLEHDYANGSNINVCSNKILQRNVFKAYDLNNLPASDYKTLLRTLNLSELLIQFIPDSKVELELGAYKNVVLNFNQNLGLCGSKKQDFISPAHLNDTNADTHVSQFKPKQYVYVTKSHTEPKNEKINKNNPLNNSTVIVSSQINAMGSEENFSNLKRNLNDLSSTSDKQSEANQTTFSRNFKLNFTTQTSPNHVSEPPSSLNLFDQAYYPSTSSRHELNYKAETEKTSSKKTTKPTVVSCPENMIDESPAIIPNKNEDRLTNQMLLASKSKNTSKYSYGNENLIMKILCHPKGAHVKRSVCNYQCDPVLCVHKERSDYDINKSEIPEQYTVSTVKEKKEEARPVEQTEKVISSMEIKSSFKISTEDNPKPFESYDCSHLVCHSTIKAREEPNHSTKDQIHCGLIESKIVPITADVIHTLSTASGVSSKNNVDTYHLSDKASKKSPLSPKIIFRMKETSENKPSLDELINGQRNPTEQVVKRSDRYDQYDPNLYEEIEWLNSDYDSDESEPSNHDIHSITRENIIVERPEKEQSSIAFASESCLSIKPFKNNWLKPTGFKSIDSSVESKDLASSVQLIESDQAWSAELNQYLVDFEKLAQPLENVLNNEKKISCDRVLSETAQNSLNTSNDISKVGHLEQCNSKELVISDSKQAEKAFSSHQIFSNIASSSDGTNKFLEDVLPDNSSVTTNKYLDLHSLSPTSQIPESNKILDSSEKSCQLIEGDPPVKAKMNDKCECNNSADIKCKMSCTMKKSHGTEFVNDAKQCYVSSLNEKVCTREIAASDNNFEENSHEGNKNLKKESQNCLSIKHAELNKTNTFHTVTTTSSDRSKDINNMTLAKLNDNSNLCKSNEDSQNLECKNNDTIDEGCINGSCSENTFTCTHSGKKTHESNIANNRVLNDVTCMSRDSAVKIDDFWFFEDSNSSASDSSVISQIVRGLENEPLTEVEPESDLPRGVEYTKFSTNYEENNDGKCLISKSDSCKTILANDQEVLTPVPSTLPTDNGNLCDIDQITPSLCALQAKPNMDYGSLMGNGSCSELQKTEIGSSYDNVIDIYASDDYLAPFPSNFITKVSDVENKDNNGNDFYTNMGELTTLDPNSNAINSTSNHPIENTHCEGTTQEANSNFERALIQVEHSLTDSMQNPMSLFLNVEHTDRFIENDTWSMQENICKEVSVVLERHCLNELKKMMAPPKQILKHNMTYRITHPEKFKIKFFRCAICEIKCREETSLKAHSKNAHDMKRPLLQSYCCNHIFSLPRFSLHVSKGCNVSDEKVKEICDVQNSEVGHEANSVQNSEVGNEANNIQNSEAGNKANNSTTEEGITVKINYETILDTIECVKSRPGKCSSYISGKSHTENKHKNNDLEMKYNVIKRQGVENKQSRSRLKDEYLEACRKRAMQPSFVRKYPKTSDNNICLLNSQTGDNIKKILTVTSLSKQASEIRVINPITKKTEIRLIKPNCNTLMTQTNEKDGESKSEIIHDVPHIKTHITPELTNISSHTNAMQSEAGSNLDLNCKNKASIQQFKINSGCDVTGSVEAIVSADQSAETKENCKKSKHQTLTKLQKPKQSLLRSNNPHYINQSEQFIANLSEIKRRSLLRLHKSHTFSVRKNDVNQDSITARPAIKNIDNADCLAQPSKTDENYLGKPLEIKIENYPNSTALENAPETMTDNLVKPFQTVPVGCVKSQTGTNDLVTPQSRRQQLVSLFQPENSVESWQPNSAKECRSRTVITKEPTPELVSDSDGEIVIRYDVEEHKKENTANELTLIKQNNVNIKMAKNDVSDVTDFSLSESSLSKQQSRQTDLSTRFQKKVDALKESVNFGILARTKESEIKHKTFSKNNKKAVSKNSDSTLIKPDLTAKPSIKKPASDSIILASLENNKSRIEPFKNISLTSEPLQGKKRLKFVRGLKTLFGGNKKIKKLKTKRLKLLPTNALSLNGLNENVDFERVQCNTIDKEISETEQKKTNKASVKPVVKNRFKANPRQAFKRCKRKIPNRLVKKILGSSILKNPGNSDGIVKVAVNHATAMKNKRKSDISTNYVHDVKQDEIKKMCFKEGAVVNDVSMPVKHDETLFGGVEGNTIKAELCQKVAHKPKRKASIRSDCNVEAALNISKSPRKRRNYDSTNIKSEDHEKLNPKEKELISAASMPLGRNEPLHENYIEAQSGEPLNRKRMRLRCKAGNQLPTGVPLTNPKKTGGREKAASVNDNSPLKSEGIHMLSTNTKGIVSGEEVRQYYSKKMDLLSQFSVSRETINYLPELARENRINTELVQTQTLSKQHLPVKDETLSAKSTQSKMTLRTDEMNKNRDKTAVIKVKTEELHQELKSLSELFTLSDENESITKSSRKSILKAKSSLKNVKRSGRKSKKEVRKLSTLKRKERKQTYERIPGHKKAKKHCPQEALQLLPEDDFINHYLCLRFLL